MPTFKLTVQLRNGEQVTAPIEAWFVAIMKQFTEAQQSDICASAAQITKESTVLFASRILPKHHQIITPNGINRLPEGRDGK